MFGKLDASLCSTRDRSIKPEKAKEEEFLTILHQFRDRAARFRLTARDRSITRKAMMHTLAVQYVAYAHIIKKPIDLSDLTNDFFNESFNFIRVRYIYTIAIVFPRKSSIFLTTSLNLQTNYCIGLV